MAPIHSYKEMKKEQTLKVLFPLGINSKTERAASFEEDWANSSTSSINWLEI